MIKKTILGVLVWGFSLSGQAHDVETVPFVDLTKYQGRWFEVASIPQSFQRNCVSDTMADYTIDGERINVVNSCKKADGKYNVARGKAKVKDPTTNSKLKVTFLRLGFWVFLAGGNYWIIGLDPEYRYAVVGDPSRKFAWILSRTPNLDQELWAHAVGDLKRQGYDTCEVLTSVQTDGFSERRPLCELLP